VPVVRKWRDVGCHNFSQKLTTHAFGWLFVLIIIPMRITMAKKLCEHVQRLNNYGLQSGYYRQLWAYSNPKWPVEWVANWPIIPQSASTRERAKQAPNIPPGGRGTPLKSFSGYRETLHGNNGPPCHGRCLAIKTPKPKWPVQWRGSPFDKKCPNRHGELKDKTGPQHPPWGPKHPQCSISRPNS
jgi:hypothetical protein